MRCALTPVARPVPALFTHHPVLKAVSKDASVMPALYLMVSGAFPWKTVDACTMGNI